MVKHTRKHVEPKPTTGVVLPFRGAEHEPPPGPPSDAPQCFTVTIDHGNGYRNEVSMCGDTESWKSFDVREGSWKNFDVRGAGWNVPEVRDLALLARAQKYLADLICKAAE
jgi:hypothetical protein